MIVTEAQLRREVIGLCDEFGLLLHYCGNSRTCKGQPGFPDLLIAGAGGLILAELKTDAGHTSADQDSWLWRLSKARNGEDAFRVEIWRPADLADGAIQTRLEYLAD